jgi:hypothetical protein
LKSIFGKEFCRACKEHLQSTKFAFYKFIHGQLLQTYSSKTSLAFSVDWFVSFGNDIIECVERTTHTFSYRRVDAASLGFGFWHLLVVYLRLKEMGGILLHFPDSTKSCTTFLFLKPHQRHHLFLLFL